MARTTDVIVIGGGPSGLHTAGRLAEKGLDVLVLEEKAEPGRNVICTGIVGSKIFSEYHLSRDSIVREIQKVKMVSPSGAVIDYQHPHPFACVVSRESFDRSLAESARSKGVAIEVKCRAVEIDVQRGHVEITASRDGDGLRKYSAKMAVIATGNEYSLQKKLGLGYSRGFLNGVQAEVMSDRDDQTKIFVGNSIAPGAFAWSVPTVGQKTKIGLLTEYDPRRSFEQLMNKFFPEQFSVLGMKQVRYKAIAQGLISGTYGERVITVGEAAGQIKTTTGGGIYYGLICSEIAAEVITKQFLSGSFSSSSLSEYEQKWKKAIEKEIIIGYRARKICAKLKDSQIERIFRLAQTDGIIPLINEKGDFDRHSDLIFALLKRLSCLKIFRGIRIQDT